MKSLAIHKHLETIASNELNYTIKLTQHTLFNDFLLSGNKNTLSTFLKFTNQYNLIDWVFKKINLWKREIIY